MHRLFLDANVLFSAAYRAGSPFVAFWKMDDVILMSSNYAVEEARNNLDSDEQRSRLKQLTQSMEIIAIYPEVQLPKNIRLPGKDEPILQAAIAAKATHLLTGDLAHFHPYYNKTVGGVLVQKPGEYLRARSARGFRRT